MFCEFAVKERKEEISKHCYCILIPINYQIKKNFFCTKWHCSRPPTHRNRIHCRPVFIFWTPSDIIIIQCIYGCGSYRSLCKGFSSIRSNTIISRSCKLILIMLTNRASFTFLPMQRHKSHDATKSYRTVSQYSVGHLRPRGQAEFHIVTPSIRVLGRLM